MYLNKIHSVKQIMHLFILLLIFTACERHPLELSYNWETYSNDKIKLINLPEVSDQDIKYLDKYIDRHTVNSEYIYMDAAIHTLEGIKYGDLLRLSKIYIQEQREKLRTASDSIKIKYLGIEEEYRGTLYRNKYEVTNLYSKKLETMTGIWKIYHKGSFMKEFSESYNVDLEPNAKVTVVSDTFHSRWSLLPNSISGKDPNNVTIEWVPKYLKFADGTREDFDLN